MRLSTLPLAALAERHPGLTAAIAAAYVEAACVCLSRHHQSPAQLALEQEAASWVCLAHWDEPDQRTRNAWANDIDATEGGAYAVSLAAVELIHGFVAVHRAQTLSGADYYIAKPGAPLEDLEGCLRLEVSGTDEGESKVIRARLLQKQQQLRNGAVNLPALAVVVGFQQLKVALASVAAA
jgi:hypothetical protein